MKIGAGEHRLALLITETESGVPKAILLGRSRAVHVKSQGQEERPAGMTAALSENFIDLSWVLHKYAELELASSLYNRTKI